MTQPVVAILGGGQLGSMFAQAASRYGVAVWSLCPEESPIIARVARHIRGDYEDVACLDQLVQGVDAVTLEFENIPVQSLRYLSDRVAVRPGAKALQIAQDRRLEKTFFRDEAKTPTTEFAVIETAQDITALHDFSFPAVLKTARDGYDGKGQVKVLSWDELSDAWASLSQVPCVLEAFVSFEEELSVIIARGVAGDVAVYGPFLNEHENHILATSWSGIHWPESIRQQAKEIAVATAEHLDYVGVLCVELFRVGDRLLVNEIAPRPHNSGHLTIEGFTSSQFDQQVRTTLGLPVAPVVQRMPTAMINLVGTTIPKEQQHQLLARKGLHWHWYGKDGAEPGRKVGHLALEAPSLAELREEVKEVKAVLARTLCS